MIDEAASNNAEVILLPEAIDLGWNGIGCSLVIDPKRVNQCKGTLWLRYRCNFICRCSFRFKVRGWIGMAGYWNK